MALKKLDKRICTLAVGMRPPLGNDSSASIIRQARAIIANPLLSSLNRQRPDVALREAVVYEFSDRCSILRLFQLTIPRY